MEKLETTRSMTSLGYKLERNWSLFRMRKSPTGIRDNVRTVLDASIQQKKKLCEEIKEFQKTPYLPTVSSESLNTSCFYPDKDHNKEYFTYYLPKFQVNWKHFRMFWRLCVCVCNIYIYILNILRSYHCCAKNSL